MRVEAVRPLPAEDAAAIGAFRFPDETPPASGCGRICREALTRIDPPCCLYGLNCEAFVPVFLETSPKENFTANRFSTNLLECEMSRFTRRRCLNVVDKTKSAE